MAGMNVGSRWRKIGKGLGAELRYGWTSMSRRGRWTVFAGLAAAVMLLLWLGSGSGDGVSSHRVGGHDALIARHAAATGLDETLVRSVVTHESGGDATAMSGKQARGLMQITAITEKDVLARNREMVADDLFNPEYNVKVGTTYLAYLLNRFDGDRVLAVAAYHMGPTAVRRAMNESPTLSSLEIVEKYGGPQTRAYVEKVLRDAPE